MAARDLTEEAAGASADRAMSVSVGHFDGSWQSLVDFQPGDAIAEIQTPPLMLAGAADGLLQANLKDFQRLPNATLHVFSRVGHGIPTDVPDEFAEVLGDFFANGVVTAQTQIAKLLAAASAS